MNNFERFTSIVGGKVLHILQEDSLWMFGLENLSDVIKQCPSRVIKPFLITGNRKGLAWKSPEKAIESFGDCRLGLRVGNITIWYLTEVMAIGLLCIDVKLGGKNTPPTECLCRQAKTSDSREKINERESIFRRTKWRILPFKETFLDVYLM